MRIRFIKAQDTWSLRHRVLRPHQTIEDCDYPNDRNPESFHLGVFIGEHLIGIGSFYAEKNDALKGWKQYRLRGMAIHPDFRAQGAGAVSVHDADLLHVGDERVVEELRHAIDRLIDRAADHVDLAHQPFTRREVDVHAHRRRSRRNALRREHVPVSIYLVNGIKLQGQIESFDQYVVLLKNTVTQMVYKHAISTVVPGRAVNFHANEPTDAA